MITGENDLNWRRRGDRVGTGKWGKEEGCEVYT